MKKTLLLFLFVGCSSPVWAQTLSLPPSGNNQKSVVRQYVGASAFVEVTYSSPDVAGREGQIWGQLVPYGLNNLGFGASTAENPSPWRAGANENTLIQFSEDMNIQGKAIAAGTYGLHLIPKEKEPWVLILSSETNGWGSYFYDPKEDVLRVEVTPEVAPFHEYLSYEFITRKPDTTTLALMWEKVSVPFQITLPDASKKTLAVLTSQLKGSAGFNDANWNQAANWALNAGFPDQALEWADYAINGPFVGQRSFANLQTKASVLRALDRKNEANELMSEAIKLPGVNAFQIHGYGRQLISDGEKDKALEVFQYNYDTNEGAWPTNYGLARAYSALGEYEKALEYLQIAKTKVPEGDALNPPIIDANLAKLQNGEDIN